MIVRKANSVEIPGTGLFAPHERTGVEICNRCKKFLLDTIRPMNFSAIV